MKNYRIIEKPDQLHGRFTVEQRMWPLFWEWDPVAPEYGGPFRFATAGEAEDFIRKLKNYKPVKVKPVKYL